MTGAQRRKATFPKTHSKSLKALRAISRCSESSSVSSNYTRLPLVTATENPTRHGACGMGLPTLRLRKSVVLFIFRKDYQSRRLRICLLGTQASEYYCYAKIIGCIVDQGTSRSWGLCLPSLCGHSILTPGLRAVDS